MPSEPPSSLVNRLAPPNWEWSRDEAMLATTHSCSSALGRLEPIIDNFHRVESPFVALNCILLAMPLHVATHVETTPPPRCRLYGGYEALKGGKTSEAMEDFTGGVVESYELDKVGDELFDRIEKNAKRSSLMSCSIK